MPSLSIISIIYFFSKTAVSWWNADSVPKPKTPYTLFLQETSKRIKENASQDNMPNGPFMTEVAKRWRSLSDSERQVYIDLAARQQEEYIKIKQSTVPSDQNETL